MAELSNEDDVLHVQICYAASDSQTILEIDVAKNTKFLAAIAQSGIVVLHPEIDISVFKVGVYGKIKSIDDVLREGDRVEIYRPLIADPMESRRRRANKTRKT